MEKRKPMVYNAGDIADLLCISKPKAYEVMNMAKCPTIYIGKRMVCPIKEFEEFLSEWARDSMAEGEGLDGLG